jgi:hypothetical protein
MPFSEFGHEVRPWGLTNRRGRHVGIHPIKSRRMDVIIHAIAADMLASHMSGLPVCPSAARSFRCIFSENIRRTSALRSQACISSIVPCLAIFVTNPRAPHCILASCKRWDIRCN